MPISFICMVYFITVLPNITLENRESLRRITSNNAFDRIKAIDQVANRFLGYQRERALPILYSIVYLNPPVFHVHPHLVDKMAEASLRSTNRQYSSRIVALSILSKWSNIESACVFFHFIDYIDGNRTVVYSTDPYYVNYLSVAGLINIGKPVLPLCIQELARIDDASISESRSYAKRTLIIYSIGMILGYGEADKFLANEINRFNTISKWQANRLERARDILHQIKGRFP